MKKKLCSMLLSVCLCVGLTLPTRAAGTELTVSAPETLPEVGGAFQVTISLSGNPGLGAVKFTLGYDESVLQCLRWDAGSMLDDTFGTVESMGMGGAHLGVITMFNPISGDGTVVTGMFRVLSDGDPNFVLKDLVLTGMRGDIVATKWSIPYHAAPQQASGSIQPPKVEEEVVTKQSFTDVPSSHWAASYIETAVKYGLVSGYSDGSFRPGNQVTRAQFVTMLWRMSGRPECETTTPFTDIVGLNTEFQTAIAWAYEQGFIGGRTATTFAPADPLTRQAAMKVLYLYTGEKLDQGTAFAQMYEGRYTDSVGLADWAKTSMYWAVYHGLISGTSDTTLGATKVATRGQLAKILVNYYANMGA